MAPTSATCSGPRHICFPGMSNRPSPRTFLHANTLEFFVHIKNKQPAFRLVLRTIRCGGKFTIQQTEELEGIVASRLDSLKRKRQRSANIANSGIGGGSSSVIQANISPASGWGSGGPAAGNAAERGRNSAGGGAGGAKDKQAPLGQQKKKKKIDKGRPADGGSESQPQPGKKRKGTGSAKDAKRCARTLSSSPGRRRRLLFD